MIPRVLGVLAFQVCGVCPGPRCTYSHGIAGFEARVWRVGPKDSSEEGCPGTILALLPALGRCLSHSSCIVCELLDDYKEIMNDLTEWVDLKAYTSNYHAALDIYVRMRTTKFEMLCLRTIRDSRRKYDHIFKYKESFQEDVGDFHDTVFGVLCSELDKILAEPPQPVEGDQSSKKAKPCAAADPPAKKAKLVAKKA
jgi:hypothetical protein